MSRVAELYGTFAQRQAAVEILRHGYRFTQSVGDTSFYTKGDHYVERDKSDMIIIYGERRVFDRLPEEPKGELDTNGYWSSDYVVVLEKPETELFHICDAIPRRQAEAGHIHGLLAVGSILGGFLVVLGLSLVLGLGWWSVLLATIFAACITAGFWYEPFVRVVCAAVYASWYVKDAIKAGHGTRAYYYELVKALSTAEPPVVAAVHTRVLKMI